MSEEKEVKKGLKEAILGIEVTQFDGQKADLEELVNPRQLEKIISDWMPEVLSQDWIDEHLWIADEISNLNKTLTVSGKVPVVKLKDLQEVLVPKQELLVIPKFVAKWIEELKPYKSLRVAFEYIAQRKRDNHDDELAFWVEEGNSETFARAWLDGYTVEEEPLYRARLKVIANKSIAAYLRTQSSNAEERLKALEIGSKYIHKDYRHLSEFTEEELKKLNIWDSDQWEIEELEE